MSITKLFSGIDERDSNASTGADVANTVNALVDKSVDLQEQIDGGGQASALISAHNSSPTAHPELSAAIEADANRAETAADVAMTAGWVYGSVASGEAARANGEYFWVISESSSNVLDLYLMGASTATATGKSTLNSKAVRTTNILFDSFHEYTADNPTLGEWNWYDAGVQAFTTSSVNIPLTTPVAVKDAATVYRKVWDTSKLGLKDGDTISMAALAWFTTSAGGRIEIYVRGPSGSTNLASSVPLMSGVSGVQIVNTSVVMPAGHARLIIQVVGSNAAGSNPFEVAGVFGFNGPTIPAAIKNEPNLDYVLAYLNASSLDARFETKANTADIADFTRASTNLFDKDSLDLVVGKYVSSTSGNLLTNANYNAIRYIPISASTDYTFSRSGEIAWFDSLKTYISGDATTADNSPKTLTSPVNAAFVGVSVKVAWMEDFRLNEGTSVLPYETAPRKLDETKINPIVNAGKSVIGKQYLKRARIKLRQRLRNTAVQLHIAMHMDSWGSANNIHYALLWHSLRVYSGGGFTAVGVAGPGWIGAAFVTSSVKSNTLGAGGLYAVTRAGTWTNNFGTDTYSPDCCSSSTTDAAATYNFTSTNTANTPSAMTLLVGGSGSFDYSWDNVSWTTVNLTDANRQAVALAGIPTAAAWVLRIRCPAITTFKIMGLLTATTDSGAVVHAINATGTYMFQRAGTDATAFAANAALINPDIVFIGTPINDRNLSRTVAQWKADVITLIGKWRAWDVAVDICLIMPPEVGGTNTTTPAMSEYAAAARDLVDTYRICVIDFQSLCGADFTDYQFSSARNSLMDNVNTHLGGATNDGIMLYQDTLLNLLTGAIN